MAKAKKPTMREKTEAWRQKLLDHGHIPDPRDVEPPVKWKPEPKTPKRTTLLVAFVRREDGRKTSQIQFA